MGTLQSTPFEKMMKHMLVLAFFVYTASAEIRVDLESDGTDRFLCGLTTRSACSSSCAGKTCTENCIATCGVFARQYSYLCSAVAASTCTSTSAAGSSPAASSPAGSGADITVS